MITVLLLKTAKSGYDDLDIIAQKEYPPHFRYPETLWYYFLTTQSYGIRTNFSISRQRIPFSK